MEYRMTLKFNSVIAHNIQKESKQDITKVVKNTKCFDISDDKTLRLAQSIYDSFGNKKNRPDIGQFKHQSKRGVFAANCSAYAENINANQNDFILLTQSFVGELKGALEDIKSAIGGYIVCIHYTDDIEGDFLLFAIIRDENKLVFTDSLDLTETAIINTEKLRISFKIKLNTLRDFNSFEQQQINADEADEADEADDYNFLYVIGSDKDKTDYFADVIGYAKGKNSKKSTESLYKFIDDKFSSQKELSNKVIEAKEKTANFLAEKNGDPVTLNELQSFYYNEFGYLIKDDKERDAFFEPFSDEMASDTYGMPNSFVGHKGTYQGKTHITLTSDNYELKIKSSQIDMEDPNAEIYLNPDSDYITIKVPVPESILKDLR